MSQVLEKEMTFVNDGLADFRFDQRGNVAIVWALMATLLMLAVGAAVDTGRWLHARDQTVAAVDAALLAGGRALQANATDEGAAIAAAPRGATPKCVDRSRTPTRAWSRRQKAHQATGKRLYTERRGF